MAGAGTLSGRRIPLKLTTKRTTPNTTQHNATSLPGADHLRDCPTLTAMLKKQAGDASKLYGAICAAPALVLQTHGLLAGKAATCYPAERFTGARLVWVWAGVGLWA